MVEKKKVIFFVPTFPVLSETFIENEIFYIQKSEKIDVRILSLSKGGQLINPELENKISYLKLNLFDIFKGFLLLAPKPRYVILTLKILLSNKNRSFIENIYLWIKSVGYTYLFSKFNPGIIFAHFLSEPSTIACVVSTLLDCDLVVSGHARDVFAESSEKKLNCELLEVKAQKAKFITLCNKKAYGSVISRVAPDLRDKIKLNYHGVLANINQPGSYAESNSLTPPEFLFLGRFVEKKGLMYLLEAVNLLNEKGVSFKLFLAGYGELYEKLAEYVAVNNLEEVVTFVNNGQGVERPEANDYFKRCTCFVLPSVDLENLDSDGIPNTILEAGTYKKPVITTDAGSILEVVQNNNTGLVTPQKNALALAEAMEKVINDPQLRNRLGEALFEKVSTEFNIIKSADALVNLMLQT